MNNCIFCKIIAGAIPARIAYEDDDVFAFHDIDARAPVHVLITPRRHIASINDVTNTDAMVMGQLTIAAKKIAQDLGVSESGYRLVINTGSAAGQTVDHIHMHLLAGRSLTWPPG